MDDLALPPAVLDALTPRFTLERQIGAGGMATVFLARDERFDRPVALKVLRRGVESGDDVTRFEREIRLLARLQHPLILPLHDSGVAADAMYFVMPYVDGETLRDRIAREGPFPVAEALRLTTEVADALAYAHAQGVIHRDMKPENVMLWRGHAVVCDFGIAAIAQAPTTVTSPARLTQAGHFIGTPGYMSPEQAAGEDDIGPESDQYSLGLLLFEMLTGSPAYAGTLRSILARQITESPPPVTALRADVPPALASTLTRALAKSPEARWPSTAAFGDALRQATTGEAPAPAPESADARLSLAILPFANVGGDSENDFFSDGITDELIGSLSRLPRLRVVSRTSAFAFRGKDVPLPEIGARLRVGYVLTGSVRRANDRLRLSAQLSRVADDSLVWSESYERRVADVFDVQDDLARRISATVRDALGSGVTITPARLHPAANVIAYDQYLQGRYQWNKRTPGALRDGMACFQRAIDADPNYAPACAGLADSHALLASSNISHPEIEYPAARACAERAIALDPTLAEGHASLGFVHFNYDWDWAAAEREFKTAIELNPSYSTARQWYSSFLSSMGRHDEAILSAQAAAALDPYSVNAIIRVGIAYSYAGEYEQATTHLERAKAMEPTLLHAHSWLANAYSGMGRHADALALAEEAYERGEGRPPFRGLLATIYKAAGRIDDARPIVHDLSATPGAAPFFLAVLHLAIGEDDKAYEYLDRGVTERADMMHTLKTSPFFADARSDPRFVRILERVGLN